jgi:hypothetical protein
MNKPVATFVITDDWEALYVDGKCIVQDHELTEGRILQALGRPERSLLGVLGYETKHIYAEDHKRLDEHLYRSGHVPQTMKELEALLGELEAEDGSDCDG